MTKAKRKAAGRPRVEDGKRVQIVSIGLLPIHLRWLDAQENRSESIRRLIEAELRRKRSP